MAIIYMRGYALVLKKALLPLLCSNPEFLMMGAVLETIGSGNYPQFILGCCGASIMSGLENR